MKLRAPATPLITVDPYFSVWSFSDELNGSQTVHWTGSPNTVNGFVTIDGEKLQFMGKSDCKPITQINSDISALVTEYEFKHLDVTFKAVFFTPLFTADLYRLSRPVSYLDLSWCSETDTAHEVSFSIEVSEEICLDKKGDSPVAVKESVLADGSKSVSIGSKEQKMLTRHGDDLRIEWGYFYLNAENDAQTYSLEQDGMTFIGVKKEISEDEASAVLFAYDDIKSLEYFGKPVEALWKKSGKSIEEAICEAREEKEEVLGSCIAFSEFIAEKAKELGGSKYADLLSLAYRQVIAGHKLAVDENGENIFISKECFSNGCAATVDVTYPSAPLFLYFNPELLKGMLRPVFRYASSDDWIFDFAPHDAGRYPVVNGQRYGSERKSDPKKYYESQMPVEECGNMLILTAAISMLEESTDFADRYSEHLSSWVNYLIEYGNDPENQLCTDDFAGHLAHNCNLSIKAIMGIAGYSKILSLKGKTEEAEKYMAIASDMAKSWVSRAANSDGSFRLAFDKPDSFSMKYNMIWDKLWKTELFPPCVMYSEFSSCKKHINAYGMPLDNRKTYTKSDWLVWTASFAPTKEEFKEFISPLWRAYNETPSRCPMTDWYDTVTSQVIGFRARTVQGGLFIKFLEGLF